MTHDAGENVRAAEAILLPAIVQRRRMPSTGNSWMAVSALLFFSEKTKERKMPK